VGSGRDTSETSALTCHKNRDWNVRGKNCHVEPCRAKISPPVHTWSEVAQTSSSLLFASTFVLLQAARLNEMYFSPCLAELKWSERIVRDVMQEYD
jgi:hypothetical protein